jgi:hypothetical protein
MAKKHMKKPENMLEKSMKLAKKKPKNSLKMQRRN